MKSNFLLEVSDVELAPPIAVGTIQILFAGQHQVAMVFGAVMTVDTALKLRRILDDALSGDPSTVPVAN